MVERTFAWLSQNRRMSKDYERLAESSEAFAYVAMTRLMASRLARCVKRVRIVGSVAGQPLRFLLEKPRL